METLEEQDGHLSGAAIMCAPQRDETRKRYLYGPRKPFTRVDIEVGSDGLRSSDPPWRSWVGRLCMTCRNDRGAQASPWPGGGTEGNDSLQRMAGNEPS